MASSKDRLVATAGPSGAKNLKTGEGTGTNSLFKRHIEARRHEAIREEAPRGFRPNRQTPRADVRDPITHDNVDTVVQTSIFTDLLHRSGESWASYREEDAARAATLSGRKFVKHVCMQLAPRVPIWILISMLWRAGFKAEAVEMARIQFAEEANEHTGKEVCMSWAKKLGTELIHPLESGDFEKPNEIAHRLIEYATAYMPEALDEMRRDFSKTRLKPAALSYGVVPIADTLTPWTAKPGRDSDSAKRPAKGASSKSKAEPAKPTAQAEGEQQPKPKREHKPRPAKASPPPAAEPAVEPAVKHEPAPQPVREDAPEAELAPIAEVFPEPVPAEPAPQPEPSKAEVAAPTTEVIAEPTPEPRKEAEVVSPEVTEAEVMAKAMDLCWTKFGKKWDKAGPQTQAMAKAAACKALSIAPKDPKHPTKPVAKAEPKKKTVRGFAGLGNLLDM